MAAEIKKIQVKDIITEMDKPATLDIGSSLMQVAEAIAKDPNHMIVITEKGKPRGVLTDEDIVTWVKDKAKGTVDLSKVTARDLNPKPMINVLSISSLDDAIGVFTATRVNKLLVTDPDGTLKGILTKMRAIETIRRQQMKAL